MCVTQEQLETMNVRKRRQAQGTTRKRAEGAEDGGGSWLPGAEIENESTGRSELLCVFCMRADELRGLAAGRYSCHSLQAAGLRSASVSILRSNAVKRGLNEMLHVLSKIELRHSPRYKQVR